MALVTSVFRVCEAWELLLIAVGFVIMVPILAVTVVVETVKWSIPSVRQRLMEEARQKREQEEMEERRNRRGKYGRRQHYSEVA